MREQNIHSTQDWNNDWTGQDPSGHSTLTLKLVKADHKLYDT